jgi:hypothetical protein
LTKIFDVKNEEDGFMLMDTAIEVIAGAEFGGNSNRKKHSPNGTSVDDAEDKEIPRSSSTAEARHFAFRIPEDKPRESNS